jgi:vitamin B12 transporter
VNTVQLSIHFAMRPSHFSLLILCFAAATASAQSPDTATLSAVVISATKVPSSRSSLTQQVTVISGDDLRARGITRVTDALRSVPGASLVQNGSTGSVTSLFLRGGESRYTKVLIDGVVVNAPGGFFDFSHLTTDNVERIEIVRGPASVVHGADAISGIVQIFTRQGRGPMNLTTDARAGNSGSREATLDVNGSGGPARYSLGGGTRRTDGVLSFNNNYYNGTLSGSFGLTPWKGTDALVSARYTNAEFHYPTDFTGAPVDSNAYRVQHRFTTGIDAKTQLGEKVLGRVLLGNNEVSDLTEDIFAPFSPSDIPPPKRHSALFSRNKRRSAEAGLTFKLPQTTSLNVGAEYVDEREKSTNSEGSVGGPTTPVSEFAADRNNVAYYSELTATSPAGASWTLSARRDDNSDYDAFTTYRAGASLPVGKDSRLRASISTAFNAPAFEQLRPTLYTVGNPDLKPERARSWEIGMEQTLVYGILKVSANYFRQRFFDMIQYVPGGPPSFLGSYANLTEATSNGYETELTLTPLNEWSGSASFTVAEPRASKVPTDFAGDLREGDALLRRPKRSGAGSITWARAGAGSFSVMGSYVGERPDVDFNEFPSPRVTLPAYTKLDVAASLEIFKSESRKSSISLTGRVDNALDRKYEDVLHYGAPRRQYLIGARLVGAM